MNWLETFRGETGIVIRDPFLLCLAEAIATVESAGGSRAIVAEDEAGGINEIGYKAIPGRPSVARATLEADPSGKLLAATARFRLFADRAEQASALAWLFRSSAYYESSRLLFILAFYCAYAPGRGEGLRELLRVFNRIAASGVHEGVLPFRMTAPQASGEAMDLNHAAARDAVRYFIEFTTQRGTSHVE